MRFCWWIVSFEYVSERYPFAQYCVFTTSAQKAMDATAILPGFVRVSTVRGTWAPLEKLLINYQI